MHHSGFISSQMGRDRSRKIEKKNYHSDPSYPTQNRKFQKKRAKKFKKLKSTIQASFQAKTGRDRSRRREKKIIIPILPAGPRIENYKKKKGKKIQQIKKHHSGFISS